MYTPNCPKQTAKTANLRRFSLRWMSVRSLRATQRAIADWGYVAMLIQASVDIQNIAAATPDVTKSKVIVGLCQ